MAGCVGTIQDYRVSNSWVLPEGVAQNEELLASIKGCLFGKKDVFVSRLSPNGKVTARVFYEYLEGAGSAVSWGKLIWKAHIPPTRSFVFWRLMHRRLPVDSLFQRQGSALASQCSICLRGIESLEHLFQDCYFARGLWISLAALFGLGVSPREPLALFHWVRNGKMSSQLKGLWEVGFFEVIWMIWQVRNKVRHGEGAPTLLAATRQLSFAITNARVFHIGNMGNTVQDLITLKQLGVPGIPRKAPVIIPVVWCPPAPGYVKVNVDGSAQGSPGRAAAGGVFRFSDGRVLAAFSAFLDPCSAFEAEAQAVMIALKQAKTLGLHKIWLETDSMLMYRLLLGRKVEVPWRIRRDWEAILVYLDSIEFRVTHIYREGNKVADRLAALGLAQRGLHWWSTFPPGILDLVIRDAMSLSSFRVRI